MTKWVRATILACGAVKEFFEKKKKISLVVYLRWSKAFEPKVCVVSDQDSWWWWWSEAVDRIFEIKTTVLYSSHNISSTKFSVHILIFIWVKRGKFYKSNVQFLCPSNTAGNTVSSNHSENSTNNHIVFNWPDTNNFKYYILLLCFSYNSSYGIYFCCYCTLILILSMTVMQTIM